MEVVNKHVWDDEGGEGLTLEFFGCVGVVFVLVRVPFQGGFTIGFLDLILGGRGRYVCGAIAG